MAKHQTFLLPVLIHVTSPEGVPGLLVEEVLMGELRKQLEETADGLDRDEQPISFTFRGAEPLASGLVEVPAHPEVRYLGP